MAISRRRRFEILQRDGFKCGYCGATADESRLEVDHITARARGGTDDDRNLVTACFDCNRGKRDHLTTVYRAPSVERAVNEWDEWNENPTGDELPRTQPRRTAPVDWSLPRADQNSMPLGDAMQMAECMTDVIANGWQT